MKHLVKGLKLGFYLLVILSAGYIMFHHLGIIEGLDFGAGAYYYADIPNFQRFVNGDHYASPVPMWVLILLFLIWGAVMYRLWIWLDRKWK